jgi:hypothetical protein
MTGQEFLKWLEQCSIGRSYNSSSGCPLGALRVEISEVNAELFVNLRPGAGGSTGTRSSGSRAARRADQSPGILGCRQRPPSVTIARHEESASGALFQR